MLYYHRAEKSTYQSIHQELALINQALDNTNWEELDDGSYPLSDKVQLNLFSYETKDRDISSWEAHRRHIDVHCLIKGQEWVDLTITDLIEVNYDEENDGVVLTGEATHGVILTPEHCLVLWPNEGHRTGIHHPDQKTIRKAVFKIQWEGVSHE